MYSFNIYAHNIEKPNYFIVDVLLQIYVLNKSIQAADDVGRKEIFYCIRGYF